MLKRSSSPRSALWFLCAAVGTVLVLGVLAAPALAAQGGSRSPDQSLALFEQVYRFIQRNYVDEVDPDVLIEGALKGMFESLDDPHSAYLFPDQMRSLTDTTSGQFGGVGLYINKPFSSRDGGPVYIEVVSPIEGTPADRAGLEAGDRIKAIEGESTADLAVDEVVDRLRGAPGSSVEVTILRGRDLEFPVTLSRAIIQIPTVRWGMIDSSTAFLRIIQFTPHTRDRVAEALEEFRQEGYTSMVIDLRSNPGGLLESVVDVADLFFDGGLVVETRGRVASENKRFQARSGRAVASDIALAVLINDGSASASEILAAALKDRDRARLFGSTTYGKGSVQQVRGLGDGGFRLTMSRYYTPAGTDIDKKGISPHEEVKEARLSEEEQRAYIDLRRENRFVDFVDQVGDPSPADIDRFVQDLLQEGVEIEADNLRRLVRAEVNRVLHRDILFDLENDRVLRRALEYLQQL
ncbi:carboxyl-terminal processing protease [Alkalispirochaeta americana]|uniref:Carboxyl-terminal processing protease n=1 Tax=Alkalispirochaeta americana TaxID=159291 RepID=A0A1N6RZW5_9SPIO|nr:carboxyl-terminal processing protease [Alkalispirochaeta americana]